MKPLYKTASDRGRVREITQRFRATIGGKTRDHHFATPHGDTFVLESGDRSKRTIVLLHGGMTNHAFILYIFRELVGRYHIICPDMPGHAGLSDDHRIDPTGDDFGHWLVEVLDALHVETADLVGVSYGGFVAGRLIALAPERVRSAALLVPGGIVDMPIMRMLRHFIVWQVLYSLTGRERFFRRMMDALFTDYDDTDVAEFFRLVLGGMRIDSRPMKLSSVEECAPYDKPMLVIGAEKDVIFECEALRKRVVELYPQATFDVLEDSMHSPSIEHEKLSDLNARVIEFLERS